VHSRTYGYAASSPLIWAFVPFTVNRGRLDGFDFDTLQSKRELAHAFRELNLPWIWQPIVDTNIDAIIEQVQRADSIVLNLCDGIGAGGTPGECVVRALERARIRFTGADSEFYEVSTSKLLMKEMMIAAGVRTPEHEAIPESGSVGGICARVGTPLLVKPEISAASGGVFLRSKVSCDDEVAALRDELWGAPLPPFCDSRSFFAERFIEGPEFTVFLLGSWRDPTSVQCLPAVERVFNASIPDGEKFLSYERYWGLYREETPPADGRPFYGYRACSAELALELAEISRAAYIAVRGCGYARVDLRMDRQTEELFVLEVNANCGLSEDDQTSTGCMLKLAEMTLAELLATILRDAGAPL
jgi:D-alanine-D-alanine ligase